MLYFIDFIIFRIVTKLLFLQKVKHISELSYFFYMTLPPNVDQWKGL